MNIPHIIMAIGYPARNLITIFLSPGVFQSLSEEVICGISSSIINVTAYPIMAIIEIQAATLIANCLRRCLRAAAVTRSISRALKSLVRWGAVISLVARDIALLCSISQQYIKFFTYSV